MSTHDHEIQCSTDPMLPDTRLHAAALAGNLQNVAELLKKDPNLARVHNREGLLPIHLASARGHVQVVKELLGVDGSLCRARDKDGRTPAHVAAACNRVEVLHELVKASKNAGFQNDDTILHSAVNHNQLDAVKFVLKNDMANIGAKDSNDNTPLHVAAARRNTLIADFLLEKNMINVVNEKNRQGQTVLDVAMDPCMGIVDADFCHRLRYHGGEVGNGPCYHGGEAGNGPSYHGGEIGNGPPDATSGRDSEERWRNDMQTTLIVVSTLIAGATYATGLQLLNEDKTVAVHPWFEVLNAASLGLSMGIILYIASGRGAKSQRTMRGLLFVLWLSMVFMALAFTFGTLYKDKSKKSYSSVSRGFMIALGALMMLLFLYHIVKSFESLLPENRRLKNWRAVRNGILNVASPTCVLNLLSEKEATENSARRPNP